MYSQKVFLWHTIPETTNTESILTQFYWTLIGHLGHSTSFLINTKDPTERCWMFQRQKWALFMSVKHLYLRPTILWCGLTQHCLQDGSVKSAWSAQGGRLPLEELNTCQNPLHAQNLKPDRAAKALITPNGAAFTPNHLQPTWPQRTLWDAEEQFMSDKDISSDLLMSHNTSADLSRIDLFKANEAFKCSFQ